MNLNLGNKIHELRKIKGVTQEILASALGITGQAVSRWEAGGSYPDMEMIPAIANYFGVSIDELFGYQSDRDVKINAVIEKVNSYHIKSRGDDKWVDECLSVIREGLIEFPQNERLLITLAETLSEAGWRRHKEWVYYNDEGFMQHNYDVHRKNEYWSEAIKISEQLAGTASDNTIVTRAIYILVMLYRNLGENDRAVICAERMPKIEHCREMMLSWAADGKQEAAYIGDLLLKMARHFSQQLVYGLINNVHHFESDMPIEKIKGAISLFDLLCDDGNYGEYNGNLIQLYLYLSRLQWERGYHDEAFESLYKALEHARALEDLLDGEEHYFTAPLVKFVKCTSGEAERIAESLPQDWPMWVNPDHSQVEKEIKADPRWDIWVKKCME
ncbi:MAG: helix-turn-helix domain-containing protein [Oscillospiraceae bacterium]|nr:helix-turn-helix domain-containing protein [Oscillospiraceae bacterium]